MCAARTFNSAPYQYELFLLINFQTSFRISTLYWAHTGWNKGPFEFRSIACVSMTKKSNARASPRARVM